MKTRSAIFAAFAKGSALGSFLILALATVLTIPQSALALQGGGWGQGSTEDSIDKANGALAASAWWQDPAHAEEVRELQETPDCPADTVVGMNEVMESRELPPGSTWEEAKTREGAREYIQQVLCE